MKRLITIFIALLLCVAFVGCTSSDLASKDKTPAETTDSEPAKTEPHVHKYGSWTVAEEATCSQQGKQIRSCECGETDTLMIEKKRHNYEESGRIEPTSAQKTDIKILYTCTGCSDSYDEKLEITGTKGLICGFAYSEEYGVYCEITGVDMYDFRAALGSSSVFQIPTTICGYPVKVIGDGAMDASMGLTSIIIPEGVAYIGENAFRTQYKLESITIPSSVTYIGKDAFADCGVLKEIHFTGTLEAFYANVQMWNALNMPQIDPFQTVTFVCSDGIGYPFG